jgi:mxaJ protein
MLAALLTVLLVAPGGPALRVCADPNNLPFSNARGEGFENELAALLGRELHLPVRYTWWAQRRGFLRNTLLARSCDVVMGVPVGLEMVRATRPYYRSSYVFATLPARRLQIRSFDDPRLATLKIGVSLVGDDGVNPPPAHALASRGIIDNVVGFTVYGDYRQESPPARVMDALVGKEIDVAVVWGPLAGAFARTRRLPLALAATPPLDHGLPFVFDIAIGVRRDDAGLQRRLDAILLRRRAQIAKLLEAHGVPLLP